MTTSTSTNYLFHLGRTPKFFPKSGQKIKNILSKLILSFAQMQYCCGFYTLVEVSTDSYYHTINKLKHLPKDLQLKGITLYLNVSSDNCKRNKSNYFSS